MDILARAIYRFQRNVAVRPKYSRDFARYTRARAPAKFTYKPGYFDRIIIADFDYFLYNVNL